MSDEFTVNGKGTYDSLNGLTAYSAANFKGDCRVAMDFVPYLDMMSQIASKYGITVLVTSSFRTDANVKGEIVTPAKMSNHMIGHAIDCNLILGGKQYTSGEMRKPSGLIAAFINDCKASGLRWGGDFSGNGCDPVHFDDATNIKNPALWQQKYNELHS